MPRLFPPEHSRVRRTAHPAAIKSAQLVGLIRDGRSGLPAAAISSGAFAAQPVSNTTGGHPVLTSAGSNTHDVLAVIRHGRTGHGGSDETARSIDALFATAYLDDRLFR